MAAVVTTGIPNKLPPVASKVAEFVALATAIATLGLMTNRASSNDGFAHTKPYASLCKSVAAAADVAPEAAAVGEPFAAPTPQAAPS